MVDYSKLRDKSGTIYAGSRAFKDPTELGGYLGIPSHQIDWGRIQKQTATPADTKDWYLSPWTATGKGDWQQQPALRIGSNQYRFDTPQEYINKMQGLTGANAQTYINQFKTANIQWAYADKIVDFKLAAEAAGADTGRKSPVITDSNLYRMKNPTTNKIYLANAHQIAYYKDLGYQFYGKGKYTPVNITTGSQAIKAQPVQQTNNNNMKYKSLLQIYDERPDLQKAFPQKGTALDDWWNVHGKKEYPGVNLVQPGDKRLTAPTSTSKTFTESLPSPEYKPLASTQEPTLIEITSQRPDVLEEASKHGGDPYTAGTGANTWLNDWYNRVGKAEGADMARRGLFGQAPTGQIPGQTGQTGQAPDDTSAYNQVIDDEVKTDPYQDLLDRWIAEQKTQSETPSWEEQQAKLREERGVGALETQIGSFDDEINRANTLLDDLETRVRGGMAKESARLAPMELITGRQQELSQQAGVQHQDILSVLKAATRGREGAVGELERKEKNIFDILKAREKESGKPMDDLIQEFKFRQLVEEQKQPNETELASFVNEVGENIVTMYDRNTGETREINLGKSYQEPTEAPTTSPTDKSVVVETSDGKNYDIMTTDGIAQAIADGVNPADIKLQLRQKGVTVGIIDDLVEQGLEKSKEIIPDWFRTQLQEQLRMSITQERLEKEWNAYQKTQETTEEVISGREL